MNNRPSWTASYADIIRLPFADGGQTSSSNMTANARPPGQQQQQTRQQKEAPSFAPSSPRRGSDLKVTHSVHGECGGEGGKIGSDGKVDPLSKLSPFPNDDIRVYQTYHSPLRRKPGVFSVYGKSNSFASFYSFDAVASKVETLDSPRPDSPFQLPIRLEEDYCQPQRQLREEDPPKLESRVTEVEIEPDSYARLRGAAETMDCIERDFFMPCMCFACAEELFCIQDASYVLCPICRVVSPMEGIDPAHKGGVGLGFNMEDLCQWQNEILSKRL